MATSMEGILIVVLSAEFAMSVVGRVVVVRSKMGEREVLFLKFRRERYNFQV